MGLVFLKKMLFVLLGLFAALLALMALYPQKTTSIAIGIERYASGLDHKTIIVGGEPWHYLEGGPKDADVLLMLHGFGGDKDNWTRFAKSLTNTYRVIAPDLPGFGESRWHPNWDYSLFPQRDRVVNLVHALGLEQIHLVGNSMGGHLSALYAYEYPDGVMSLTLLDNAGVVSPVESDFQLALAQGKNPLIVHSLDGFDRLIEYAVYKKPFAPWPVKGVLAQRALDRVEKNQSIFTAIEGDSTADLEPLLAQIKIPVLIIWGECDRIIDVSSVEKMRPLLPQVEAIIMEDTGHMPMLERPSETAIHYLQFLGRVVSQQ
jgi:pimeloyl-ACP methyl ester carboxylesterase